jgi:hypothetical protein
MNACESNSPFEKKKMSAKEKFSRVDDFSENGALSNNKRKLLAQTRII